MRFPSSWERGLNLGRYVLLEKLGEGGMGVVYAAYDSTLDRKVALKFLRASQGGKRLLREAQVMARVSHPNIVALFDAATFQERVFVSME